MKNWNDAGTVHYDASTNENVQRVDLKFEVLGRQIELPLLVPLRIRGALKSHHWDAAVDRAECLMQEQMAATIAAGWSWNDFWFRRATKVVTKAVCEQLYAEFMHQQAKAGNQVWAVPQQMVDVGPPPEDDAL